MINLQNFVDQLMLVKTIIIVFLFAGCLCYLSLAEIVYFLCLSMQTSGLELTRSLWQACLKAFDHIWSIDRKLCPEVREAGNNVLK